MWLKQRLVHISLLVQSIILGISLLEVYLEGDPSFTLVSLLVCILIFSCKLIFYCWLYHSLSALGCVPVVGDVRGASLSFRLHRLSLSFHLLLFLCHSVKFKASYEHNSEFGSGYFLRVMQIADCIFSLVISGVLFLCGCV